MLHFGVTEKKQNDLADRMKKCGVKESDLEEKFTHSSGPGGQHVNKTATCVHLRHIPTGTQVKAQKARSQALNRYYARKILCEQIENQALGAQSPEQIRIEKIRKQKNRRKRRSRSGKSE